MREYIRWLPDEPSEPTSTIALTSPGRKYVDVRVLLASKNGGAGKDDPGELTHRASELPLKNVPLLMHSRLVVHLSDQLEWAFAGTSLPSAPHDDGHGGTVTHVQWQHWIDSRTHEGEPTSDEGDNYSQPDGSTLEKGRMGNPTTGLETDYEELWRSPPILPTNSAFEPPEGTDEQRVARCIVLKMHDDSRQERGMVVLLGQYCQGFMREGDEITVERWEWSSEVRHWGKSFRAGKGLLACEAAIEHAHELEKDTDLVLGLQYWTVVELIQL